MNVKITLDILRVTKEVRQIADISRADYMKIRRSSKKTFSVSVDKEKMLQF